MKKITSFISPLLLAYYILGCTQYPASENYPTEILFQYIDMSVSKNNIRVDVDYYANQQLSTQNVEQNYIVINQKDTRYPVGDYTSSIDLGDQLTDGDRIDVLFQRADSSELVSRTSIYFTDIESPLPDQVIDPSVEDINIEWRSEINRVERVKLTSHCFNFDYDYSVQAEQTSLIVDAGELIAISNVPQNCETTILLIHQGIGEIDPTFGGGNFEIEVQSQVEIILNWSGR